MSFLLNLAANWADQRFVKANDTLRRKALRAQAAVERLQQAAIADANETGFKLRKAERALALATAELDESTATVKNLRATLAQRDKQIECQADWIEAERDQWEASKRALKARVAELEATVVAMSGQGGEDAHWASVAAISGPEGSRP